MSVKIEKDDLIGKEKIKKEHKKKWKKILWRRRVPIMILIALQMLLAIVVTAFISISFWPTGIVLSAISAVMAIYVFTKDKTKISYKIIWVFIILAFPFIGGLLYILVMIQKKIFMHSKNMEAVSTFALDPPDASDDLLAQMEDHDIDIHNSKYLARHCGYPVYKSQSAVFYPEGEDFYKALIEELGKAEKYIFIEIFIIDKGIFWDSVLDILKRKAAQGLDVRVLCDDLGCIVTLPGNFKKTLESHNIKCHVFNKFKPLFDTTLNYRDHRKIISIDGKVAFSGGINLADEYINTYYKFGYWKDTGFKVEGPAAWKFTKIMLSLWNYASGTIGEDVNIYRPDIDIGVSDEYTGYVQPYAASPIEKEDVSEHIYLNIINRTSKYLYIMTPYFIIGESLMKALTVASKSGVDVRVIVPSIPDKVLTNEITKSYYDELLESGIRIFEFTPGFIHAKEVVSDGRVAVVGTVNFDYRSLDLHFEDGCCFYDSSVVEAVKKDFDNTFEQSQEITEQNNKPSKLRRAFRKFASMFGSFF